MAYQEHKIELSPSCEIVFSCFGSDRVADDCTLDYVEHSPAHGYSYTDTTIDIDKDKAIEIVNALKAHFNI